MKLSKETKLGLIYLKRKILRHAQSMEIGEEVGSIIDVDYVLVEDIEDVFDNILTESELSDKDRFKHEMQKDIEDLFRSLTPEEVAAMNKR